MYDNIIICNNFSMKTSRARTSRVFTISFPEELAKQVVAVAEEESRNISELFREAFRSYRIERMRNRVSPLFERMRLSASHTSTPKTMWKRSSMKYEARVFYKERKSLDRRHRFWGMDLRLAIRGHSPFGLRAGLCKRPNCNQRFNRSRNSNSVENKIRLVRRGD